MKRSLLLLAITSLVGTMVGCGSSDEHTPKPLPETSVSGHAVDAIIKDGTVSAYEFKTGSKGGLLGQAKTDDEGRYTLEIAAASQVILLELTGGYYQEEATAKKITLKDGQVLRALVPYSSGVPLDSVIVSPATNIATGFSQWRFAQGGIEIYGADKMGSSAVTDIVGADILRTVPLDITEAQNASSTLSDGHAYGFFLAGISQWTLETSKGVVDPHGIGLTSIHLAQLMYDDIRADGKLDGFGYLKDGSKGQLSFGVTKLDANAYRAGFARGMVAIAASDRNRTQISGGDLVDKASVLSKKTDLFGDQVPIPFDQDGPLLAPAKENAEGTYHGGTINFAVIATDLVGVASVDFDVDGNVIGSAADPRAPAFPINTKNYLDGVHKIGVRAKDSLGHDTYLQVSINVLNSGPALNMTSSALVNNVNYSIFGTYDDHGAGISEIVVSDIKAKLDPEKKTWKVDGLVLVPGYNSIQVKGKDLIGGEAKAVFSVAVDVGVPTVSANKSSKNGRIRYSDGQGKFYYKDELIAENTNEVLYFEPGNINLGDGGDPVVTTSQAEEFISNRWIPYFGLNVSDPASNDVYTEKGNLKVYVTYSRGSDLVFKDRLLKVGLSGYFYIPITAETLGPDWYLVNRDTVHTLVVVAIDNAGNKSKETQLTFRAEVVIPAIPTVTETAPSTLDKATFATRAALSGVTVDTAVYNVTNPYAFPLWVYLEPSNNNNFAQTWDSKKRLYRWRKITQEEWKATPFVVTSVTESGAPNDPTRTVTCSAAALYEQSIDQVAVYPGGVEKKLPSAVYGAYSDRAETAPTESWTNWGKKTFTGVDLGYANYKTKDGYFASVPTLSWSTTGVGYTPSCQSVKTSSTSPLNTFQYRTHTYYQYDPAKPKVDETKIGTAGGAFSGAKLVVQMPDGAAVQEEGGWYRILPKSNIRVTKSVTLPTFTAYNDAVILDANFISADFKNYDKSLSWTLDQKLTINAVIDGGRAPRGVSGTVTVVNADNRVVTIGR